VTIRLDYLLCLPGSRAQRCKSRSPSHPHHRCRRFGQAGMQDRPKALLAACHRE